jgi:hypothetical protein
MVQEKVERENTLSKPVQNKSDTPKAVQGERTGFLKPLLGMDLDEKIGYIKKRRNPCY